MLFVIIIRLANISAFGIIEMKVLLFICIVLIVLTNLESQKFRLEELGLILFSQAMKEKKRSCEVIEKYKYGLMYENFDRKGLTINKEITRISDAGIECLLIARTFRI